MSNVTLFGFPRSTFVKVVGLILTAKGVPYTFHDTEDEMYLAIHLQRHPFGREPVLQHDDFMLYETSAIAAYVDRKSTRLNSSHQIISYAVFCLKKKIKK